MALGNQFQLNPSILLLLCKFTLATEETLHLLLPDLETVPSSKPSHRTNSGSREPFPAVFELINLASIVPFHSASALKINAVHLTLPFALPIEEDGNSDLLLLFPDLLTKRANGTVITLLRSLLFMKSSHLKTYLTCELQT